jgi:hypothetical protein
MPEVPWAGRGFFTPLPLSSFQGYRQPRARVLNAELQRLHREPRMHSFGDCPILDARFSIADSPARVFDLRWGAAVTETSRGAHPRFQLEAVLRYDNKELRSIW